MANIDVQDITDLELVADKSYPLVGVRISRSINSLPICTVTISCGGVLNTNGTITTPSFPQLDTRASVVATIGGKRTTLFGGYITAEVTETSSTYADIKSYKAFRIGSATEYLDCIPPSSLTYLDNDLAGTSLLSQGTLISGEASKRAKAALTTKLAKDIQADVTSLILTAVQQANDNYMVNGPLTVTKYITGDRIKVNLPVKHAYSGIVSLLTSYVKLGLNYFQLIYRACMDLGLTLVPVSFGGIDMLCIKNRPAWCSDNMQTINIGDYIGMQSSYSSISNKRVDGVIIPLRDDLQSITSSTGFVMYGEGFGSRGVPAVITGNTLNKSKRVRLKCKLVEIPGWLKMIVKDVPFKKVAMAKAVTEFANHAHQQSTAAVAITYTKYSKLVNAIGDMVKLEVIKDEDLKSLDSGVATEYVYGRLSSLDLAINANNSKIAVSCSCVLTHVVTPAIFNKYKITKSQTLFT